MAHRMMDPGRLLVSRCWPVRWVEFRGFDQATTKRRGIVPPCEPLPRTDSGKADRTPLGGTVEQVSVEIVQAAIGLAARIQTPMTMNINPSRTNKGGNFQSPIALIKAAAAFSPGFPLSKWTTNLVKPCKAFDGRGVGRDRGGVEVGRQWVRRRNSLFSSLSIARLELISRFTVTSDGGSFQPQFAWFKRGVIQAFVAMPDAKGSWYWYPTARSLMDEGK
jgi:hypothetical protein